MQKQSKSPRGNTNARSGGAAFHPFARVFVVHFAESCGAKNERFAGRVEHLRSGRRSSFSSRKGLIDFVASVLGEQGPAEHGKL
jgi:hypothetical protein